MTAFHVLVTGKTLSEPARKILADAGATLTYMGHPVSEAEMLAAFAAKPYVASILRGPAPFNPKVLDAAKELKIISKYGAGVDSVDIDHATSRGIAVMIAGGANADAVAEHALAMMLSLCRELPQYDAQLRGGNWKDQNYLVRDFKGRTVGIVGYGQIGQRTARLAAACGANVVILSRSRFTPPPGMTRAETLEALLPQIDILSLHCPLTPRTRGLIDGKALGRMKPGGLLINTARGNVVVEPDLIAALQSGHLAGAGIDTFAKEPPERSNALFAMPNVICTPHIASATTDASIQMGIIAANNIVSYLRGEVPDARNFLNPQAMRRD